MPHLLYLLVVVLKKFFLMMRTLWLFMILKVVMRRMLRSILRLRRLIVGQLLLIGFGRLPGRRLPGQMSPMRHLLTSLLLVGLPSLSTTMVMLSGGTAVVVFSACDYSTVGSKIRFTFMVTLTHSDAVMRSLSCPKQKPMFAIPLLSFFH